MKWRHRFQIVAGATARTSMDHRVSCESLKDIIVLTSCKWLHNCFHISTSLARIPILWHLSCGLVKASFIPSSCKCWTSLKALSGVQLLMLILHQLQCFSVDSQFVTEHTMHELLDRLTHLPKYLNFLRWLTEYGSLVWMPNARIHDIRIFLVCTPNAQNHVQLQCGDYDNSSRICHIFLLDTINFVHRVDSLCCKFAYTIIDWIWINSFECTNFVLTQNNTPLNSTCDDWNFTFSPPIGLFFFVNFMISILFISNSPGWCYSWFPSLNAKRPNTCRPRTPSLNTKRSETQFHYFPQSSSLLPRLKEWCCLKLPKMSVTQFLIWISLSLRFCCWVPCEAPKRVWFYFHVAALFIQVTDNASPDSSQRHWIQWPIRSRWMLWLGKDWRFDPVDVVVQISVWIEDWCTHR